MHPKNQIPCHLQQDKKYRELSDVLLWISWCLTSTLILKPPTIMSRKASVWTVSAELFLCVQPRQDNIFSLKLRWSLSFPNFRFQEDHLRLWKIGNSNDIRTWATARNSWERRYKGRVSLQYVLAGKRGNTGHPWACAIGVIAIFDRHLRKLGSFLTSSTTENASFYAPSNHIPMTNKIEQNV